jgi:hypothetical protein
MKIKTNDFLKKMKNKILITTVIIFFLTINTSYFWEDKIGHLAFLIFLLLLTTYIIFFAVFTWHFFLMIGEKFKNKSRFLYTGILSFVLILTFFSPRGFINFEKLLEGKDLLIARAEGVAGCGTIFKLKENLTFVKTDICFKMEKTKGKYWISNDTIRFNKQYTFAVIRRQKPYDVYSLSLFKNDSFYSNFLIIKNNLNIKPIE